MLTKTISTRIILKHDTSTNWDASNFVPKLGEIILYSDLDKIKIGDGISKASSLPFTYTNNIMKEKLIAFPNSEYTVYQVRNSIFTPDANTAPTENGAIVWHYK